MLFPTPRFSVLKHYRVEAVFGARVSRKEKIMVVREHTKNDNNLPPPQACALAHELVLRVASWFCCCFFDILCTKIPWPHQPSPYTISLVKRPCWELGALVAFFSDKLNEVDWSSHLVYIDYCSMDRFVWMCQTHNKRGQRVFTTICTHDKLSPIARSKMRNFIMVIGHKRKKPHTILIGHKIP